MTKIFSLLIAMLLIPAFALATTDDAAASWSYDDTVTTDDSGNGYDGTVTGASHSTTGCQVGTGCYSFDGADDYISAGDALASSASANPVSVTVWVKGVTDDGDFEHVIGDGRTNTGGGIVISVDGQNNDLQLQASNAGGWDCPINLGGSTWSTLTDGNWHMIAGGHNGTNCWLSLDAGTITTAAITGTLLDGGEWTVGARHTDFANDFDGYADQAIVYDRFLKPSEIDELYNSGSGYDPYAAGPGGDDPWLISFDATNVVSDTGIVGFCINLTKASGFESICNTTSNVYYSNNVSELINITFWGNYSFFDQTTYQYNNSGADTVSFDTWGAWLSITARTLYLNNSVSGFNATNDQQFNTTATTPLMIKADQGANEVKLDVAGNYSLLINLTATDARATNNVIAYGVYDHLFKMNATDALSGSAVNDFTVELYNNTLGGSLANHTTSNGTYYVPSIQNYYYFFEIDAENYALANTTLQATNETTEYEFSLLPTNSLFLFFFDQTDNSVITENVTVTFDNNATSFQNTSDSGDMVATDLAVGTWTITADAPSYDESTYYVTMVNRTTQTLNVYLLNSSLSGETTFNVKDATTGNKIIGAIFTMYQLINGSYVSIGQETTDAFGIAFWTLMQGEDYQFIISADTYTTKAGNFTRTTDEYTIALSRDTASDFITYSDDFTYTYTPTASVLLPQQQNFTLTTSSPEGEINWFAVVVSVNDSVIGTTNITGSPSGGSAIASVNLSPWNRYTVTAKYYVKSNSFEYPFVITRNYYVYGATAGDYTFAGFMTYYGEDGLSPLSTPVRGVMLTIVAAVLAAIAAFFFGITAGAALAVLTFIVGAYFSWISTTVAIIVCVALVGGIIAKEVVF